MNRIRFVPQEELSVFDNNGQVLLEKPNKLALDDTGIGGIIKHIYSTTVLDSLKHNGIEYVVIQPLTNLMSKLYDTEILGRCIYGKFPSVVKIYEKPKVELTSDLIFHFKGIDEVYHFNSECVLNIKLLCDEGILTRFNISEMLRTLTVTKEFIDLKTGSLCVGKVKALKLLMKDFLGCGGGTGSVSYPEYAYRQFTTDSNINRL